MKYHYNKNNKCIDCKILICNLAVRCKKCRTKNQKTTYYCNFCGKEVTWRQSRCKKCAALYMIKENSPNWKGGKPHCKTCNTNRNYWIKYFKT